jgi:hypothetical protein
MSVTAESRVTTENITGHVRQLLDDLGRTPREIAAKLQDLNICGYVGSAESCPLANYLSQHAYSACVGDSEVSIQGIDVPMRPAHRWFVHDFDAGKFPHLIAP